MRNLLSIQSWVACGHVGNASAVLPLQRLGIDVWAVNTVQFSNHTGYGVWRGSMFSGEMIREVVTGIEERGVLASCDGVLSGYMGGPGIGEAILEAVAKVKGANPAALYCCDPVIGDVGSGVYVRAGIPEFMKEHAIPAADVITPNQFELEFLAGRPIRTLDDLHAALDTAHALGPQVVLATSVHLDDTPVGAIDMVAPDEWSRWRAHAAPPVVDQRRGRRRRRAVLPALRAGRPRRYRARQGGGLDLRSSAPNRGSRIARDSDGRRAGRIRGAEHAVRGRTAGRVRAGRVAISRPCQTDRS